MTQFFLTIYAFCLPFEDLLNLPKKMLIVLVHNFRLMFAKLLSIVCLRLAFSRLDTGGSMYPNSSGYSDTFFFAKHNTQMYSAIKSYNKSRKIRVSASKSRTLNLNGHVTFSDGDLQQYLFTHTHHLHYVLQQNLQL